MESNLNQDQMAIMGVKAIQGMQIEDIEYILDWLEQSVSAWRTLLVIKRLLDNRPSAVELPPFMSVDLTSPDIEDSTEDPENPDSDKFTVGGKIRSTWLDRNIKTLLLEHPKGLRCVEIAKLLNIPVNSVNSFMYGRRGSTYVNNRGVWVYAGDGNPLVIKEMLRTGNG